MQFIPNEGLVLVRLITDEQKSEAGLILDQAKSLGADLPLYGEVVAAGFFAQYEDGALVLARRYTGIKVEVDGEEMFIYDGDRDILGRFEIAD